MDTAWVPLEDIGDEPEFLSPLSLTSSIMERTVRRLYQQVFRFNIIVAGFREHEEKLIAAEDRIQALVEETLVNNDVQDWLEETQNVLEAVQRLRNETETKRRFTWNVNWIRQYRLRKKVVQMMHVLKKLLATPEVDQVDIDDIFPSIQLLLNDDSLLNNSKSFNLAFEKIMEALKNDAVSMIAVWGMAGVGKTTLVREVEKRARQINFHRVIRTSVSSTPDLRKIQDEIAGSLLEMTNEKRVLIILDDVWDGLDLEAIGIPRDEAHKGCKILVTTRCEQACIDMRIQKVIQLDILSDDEACVLFKMHAGDRSDVASPFITDAAMKIAKECQGLPIAMVKLGRSLKRQDLNMWEITSQALRGPRFEGGECFEAVEVIYQCLRLSYDHLREETTKLCFLLCSFFPEDYAIDVEDLTRYAWGLGFYDASIDSISKARCEVSKAIKNLKSSCLLLDNGERSVKMHNLVRHCALWIASQANISFMKEWQEVDHQDLPERFAGELEILSLDGSGCRTSSSARIEGMKSLKALTLRCLDGHLSASALENLTNLRTLHLVCCQLYDISSLGKLEKLEILSFRGSDISQLPDEIGGLNLLKLLDLFDCQKLQKVPVDLMRKLSQLEELYFNCHSFEEWWSDEEKSTTGSQARPLESSEIIPPGSLPPNLQTYEITINEDGSSDVDHQNSRSRILRVTVSLDTFKDLFQKAEYFDYKKKQPAFGRSARELIVVDNVPTLLLSDSGLDLTEPKVTSTWDRSTDYESLRNLKVVNIKNCRRLTSLSISLAWLEHLENLQIDGCPALKQVCPDTFSTLCWPSLVTLDITNCELLEYVFRITRASFAPWLRVLNISHCPRLNRVFEVTNEHIKFPRLKQLALERLRCLTAFCSGEFSIGLPSLEELEVEECPQLSISGIIRCSQVKDLRLSKMGGQLFEEIVQLHGGYFLSSLEKLMLKEISDLEDIFNDPSQIVTLQNLSHLAVFKCKTLKIIFSVLLARNLPKLSHLEVEGCEELEQVVARDQISSSSMAPDQKSVCFPNLEKVCIMKCNKLKSLFPDSFCRLPKLKRLEVKGASNLREIFGHDSGAKMTNNEKLKEVLLPELEELVLLNLPELIRFTTVGYYFVFPALINLKVKECRSTIMRFSLVHDDSGGSYVRAETEKSELPKEDNAEKSIKIQIIQPYLGKNIDWVHPEKGKKVTNPVSGKRNKANTSPLPGKRNRINNHFRRRR